MRQRVPTHIKPVASCIVARCQCGLIKRNINIVKFNSKCTPPLLNPRCILPCSSKNELSHKFGNKMIDGHVFARARHTDYIVDPKSGKMHVTFTRTFKRII